MSPRERLTLPALLLLLLAVTAADTVPEAGLCGALGDCRVLTTAGGATVVPIGGASDRYGDGDGATVVKRSAQGEQPDSAAAAGGTEPSADSGGGATTQPPPAAAAEGQGDDLQPEIVTSAAAEPAEARPAEPADSGGTEPTGTDEVGTDTVEPVETDGAEPAQTDGAETVTVDPVEPGRTETPESSAAEPAETGTTDTVESSGTEPDKTAAEADDTGSAKADEADKADADKAGPTEKDEAEPAEKEEEEDWRTDHCTCDLTVAECDVDCCCDPDCEPQDRLAFSTCLKRPSITPDSRYCLQSEVVVSNSTEHRLVRTQGGLFCIARDNLASRVRVPTVQPVTSSVDFDRLLSRSSSDVQRYGWEETGVPADHRPPPATERYRSGDLLWAVGDGAPRLWGVQWRGPVSAGLCDAVRPVRFLRPAHTDCWLTADPDRLAPLDARNMYRDICLLTAPPTDETKGVRCGEIAAAGPAEGEPKEVASLPVVPYLCDDNHQNCTQVSEVPRPRVSSGRVRDVLLSALLVVEHRAGRLTGARAELVLGNISLSATVRQRRAVQFRRPAAPPPLLRSGNPGYQRLRPLLTAALVTNSSGEGAPRRLPSGAVSPLLLPAPGRGGGVCSPERRDWRELVFGADASVGCRLDWAAGDCAGLQRHLMDTLLGGLPAEPGDTAVFAFGDGELKGDWVPVLGGRPQLTPETTASGCRGLVTAVHWRVLVARVGSVSQPQARVVGVRLGFGRARAVWVPPGPGARLSVTAQSSVTYQDVTRRPERRFAQPPRIDLSLPADFFYPFSAGAAAPVGRLGSVTTQLAAALLALRLVV